MEILNDFVMPANVRQGAGSKYFTREIMEVLEQINPGQVVLLPHVGTETPGYLKAQVKYYTEKHFSGRQTEFQYACLPERKGIAVKCLKKPEKVVAEAPKKVVAEAPKVEAPEAQAGDVE